MTALDVPEGVVIDGVINPGFEKVLTKEAVAFVADLQRRFNPRRVREIVREESDKVKAEMGEAAYADGRYEDAAQLMLDLVEQPQFEEFLTLPAYDRVLADEKKAA